MTGGGGASAWRAQPPLPRRLQPVAALLAAGAVILGKTAVQELGLGVRGTNASYGATKNVRRLRRQRSAPARTPTPTRSPLI